MAAGPAGSGQRGCPAASFLPGPVPDRTTWEGWNRWRLTRRDFVPAPVVTAEEHAADDTAAAAPARPAPRRDPLQPGDPGNPDERLRLEEDAVPDRGQRVLPRARTPGPA